jgi:hypothetical protein
VPVICPAPIVNAFLFPGLRAPPKAAAAQGSAAEFFQGFPF